jgi:hypothetical protein
VNAGFLSGFKSVALGADGYTRQSNQLVSDDTTGRLRTKLATDTAATHQTVRFMLVKGGALNGESN